jgi:molybdopterin converting factor small subunit
MEGETVRDILTRLGVENGKFRDFVFDPETLKLAEGLIIVLNGRLLDLVGGLAAHLCPGDRLEIVPGFAGG